MFAYFFDINREAFSRFAREVLHIEVQTDFTIEREKRNIDLLISDKNNAVVIENKIKSSINGIDDRHDIYSDQVQSQLKNTINLLHLMMSIAIKQRAALFFRLITIALT